MTDTIIILSVLVVAVVACIIWLIVITFREKKMNEKPTYTSPVGDWLCGKRR